MARSKSKHIRMKSTRMQAYRRRMKKRKAAAKAAKAAK